MTLQVCFGLYSYIIQIHLSSRSPTNDRVFFFRSFTVEHGVHGSITMSKWYWSSGCKAAPDHYTTTTTTRFDYFTGQASLNSFCGKYKKAFCSFFVALVINVKHYNSLDHLNHILQTLQSKYLSFLWLHATCSSYSNLLFVVLLKRGRRVY